MNIKELIAKQQALINAAKAENRGLTADELQEFEAYQKEIDGLLTKNSGSGIPHNSENGLEAERVRVVDITQLCKEFNLDSLDYIQNGATVDSVRTAIIEKLKKEKAPIATGKPSDVSVNLDEFDKFRAAAVDGIILRSGEIPISQAAPGANDFRNMTLKDLAIAVMARHGENMDSLIRMSPDDLYTKIVSERAYFSPEASFPAILDETINKSYTEMYNKAPATFEVFCKIGSLKDFKKHDNYYVAGPAGEFKEVHESGELVHDIPQDSKRPQRQLKTYGRQFTMTRKAFIDDDIGFLTTVPGRYAQASKMTINKKVYSILFNNPVIYDGEAFFESSPHKNLMTAGTGVTSVALNKMITALSIQKDEFGEAIILNPGAIVCPVGYAMDIYGILQSPTIQTSGNTQSANHLYQLRNKLTVVEDATLNVLAGTSAAPWFLMADKDSAPAIEVDFLNGQQVPKIRRMEQPGVLGFVWDIYIDFGIAVMDYRCAVKNPGIAIPDPLA